MAAQGGGGTASSPLPVASLTGRKIRPGRRAPCPCLPSLCRGRRPEDMNTSQTPVLAAEEHGTKPHTHFPWRHAFPDVAVLAPLPEQTCLRLPGLRGLQSMMPPPFSWVSVRSGQGLITRCVCRVQNAQGILPFFFFFFLIVFSRAASVAYGGSQARGLIGALATGLCHSHSNARSEPRLQHTPQLTATPDP